MSSDFNPNARYVIQRTKDKFYWNGRGWTRLPKRALKFAHRGLACSTDTGVNPLHTQVVEVKK